MVGRQPKCSIRSYLSYMEHNRFIRFLSRNLWVSFEWSIYSRFSFWPTEQLGGFETKFSNQAVFSRGIAIATPIEFLPY